MSAVSLDGFVQGSDQAGEPWVDSWVEALELVPDVDTSGKNIYVVGGPTLVTSLLNEGLLDELCLIVHPLLLGGFMALFEKVAGRRPLHFVSAEPTDRGKVALRYRT